MIIFENILIVRDFKCCKRWKKPSAYFLQYKTVCTWAVLSAYNLHSSKFLQIYLKYCHKFNFTDIMWNGSLVIIAQKSINSCIHVLIRRNLKLFLKRHLPEDGQNIPIKCINPVHMLGFRWEETWALFAACDAARGENIELNRFNEELYAELLMLSFAFLIRNIYVSLMRMQMSGWRDIRMNTIYLIRGFYWNRKLLLWNI